MHKNDLINPSNPSDNSSPILICGDVFSLPLEILHHTMPDVALTRQQPNKADVSKQKKMAHAIATSQISRQEAERLSFHAVISRLIASIVNEGLAQCSWNETRQEGMLRQSFSNVRDAATISFSLRDAMFTDPSKNVTFMDPQDITQGRVLLHTKEHSSNLSISDFMHTISDWNGFDRDKVDSIIQELDSCYENAILRYLSPPATPTLDTEPIEWEQSLIEGHATHPMFRSRMSVTNDVQVLDPERLLTIKIRFIAFPRDQLIVFGNYPRDIMPLFEKLGIRDDDATNQVIPIHEHHMGHVKARFGHLAYDILDASCDARAQASTRTVVPWDLNTNKPLLDNLALKLPLGIKITSALRTITPWTTQVGVELNKHWPNMHHLDTQILHVCRELASFSNSSPDYDIAKFVSCIVREEATTWVRPGESVALCAALVEKSNGGRGEAVVVTAWGLDTPAKRVAFLESYVDLLLRALLPPIIHHGFAFEAHGQNMLVHYDKSTGTLLGFSTRDFGGIKVWQDQFEKSTGHRIKMLKDNATESHSLKEMFDVAYHTLIQSHLHRLIRALDLHSTREGWKILRRALERQIPKDHELYAAWLDKDTSSYKAFIRMKAEGLYRDYTYVDVPNLLNLGR